LYQFNIHHSLILELARQTDRSTPVVLLNALSQLKFNRKLLVSTRIKWCKPGQTFFSKCIIFLITVNVFLIKCKKF